MRLDVVDAIGGSQQVSKISRTFTCVQAKFASEDVFI